MQSRIVEMRESGTGIVHLTMCDRVNKNAFSLDLVEQLAGAFAAIRTSTKHKVVVISGYDTYFASGGTKAGLLAIHEAKARFTDSNLYSMPLDCELPVIAAMQGHGIGGGFVFGLFADIIVLSRESIYTTNFMRYGFTPGMGATFIVPKKMGFSLGVEMLLGAQTYHGGDLERRGVGFPVLPRGQVVEYARHLAGELADKPRLALTTLKTHLVSGLRQALPEIVQQEVAMHDLTVHQPEVKGRIEALFGN